MKLLLFLFLPLLIMGYLIYSGIVSLYTIFFWSLLIFLTLSLVIVILIFIPLKIKGKPKLNGEPNRYGQIEVSYLFDSIKFSYQKKLQGDEKLSLILFGYEVIGE